MTARHHLSCVKDFELNPGAFNPLVWFVWIRWIGRNTVRVCWWSPSASGSAGFYQLCAIFRLKKKTYLGITIMKNEETRCSGSFNPVTDKSRKKLSQWLHRDLSLEGRVFLAKAEGLSRLADAAISVFVNKQMCNTSDKFLFCSVVLNTNENGGRCFPRFCFS